MDLKQIKELMVAMGRTGTKRLVVKKDNFELQLEREDLPTQVDESSMEFSELGQRRSNLALQAGTGMPKPADIPPSYHPPVETPTIPKEKEDGLFITSPMVGTFYASAGPDEPSFIKIGDRVEKDTVVCIIEAMKVMNEVKAGVAGKVSQILVESGHPVEFKSKLFKISP